MKAASDTSPIIFLSKLNALDILLECFDEVILPQAVKAELGNLTLPNGIRVQAVSVLGGEFVAGALGRLHHGELEAMVLAKESNADYVLLDDLLARHKAQRLGLQVMGTVGLIVLASRQKRIDEYTANTWLDQLVQQHGLYLSAEMLIRVKTELAHKES